MDTYGFCENYFLNDSKLDSLIMYLEKLYLSNDRVSKMERNIFFKLLITLCYVIGIVSIKNTKKLLVF